MLYERVMNMVDHVLEYRQLMKQDIYFYNELTGDFTKLESIIGHPTDDDKYIVNGIHHLNGKAGLFKGVLG